jgi:hypothetical protein
MGEVDSNSCVHDSPLQGSGFHGLRNLGRCPRLGYLAPLGLKSWMGPRFEHVTALGLKSSVDSDQGQFPTIFKFSLPPSLASLASWRFKFQPIPSHV